MANLTKVKVKEYLRYNYDLTFDLIVKDLGVSKKDIQKLTKILDKLVEEEWVHKGYCRKHKVEEYGPGFKVDGWIKTDVKTRADDL